MKRVINFEHYKENWLDYGEFMGTLLLETLVGAVMLIGFTFAVVLVLAGYHPTWEDTDDTW